MVNEKKVRNFAWIILIIGLVLLVVPNIFAAVIIVTDSKLGITLTAVGAILLWLMRR